MKRGFTLIELLVCIAMVAIITAILYPVFYRAKELSHIQKILEGTRPVEQCDRDFVAGWPDTRLVRENRDRLSVLMGTNVGPSPNDGETPRSISVLLKDGRSMTVSIMIPSGSEIESVSVQPVSAEAPQGR